MQPIFVSIASITINAQPTEIGGQLLASLADPIAAAQFGAARQGLEIRHDVVIDHGTGLMWCREDVSADDLNHADFVKACADCRVGDFDDWRPPNPHELNSLVVYTEFNPCINKEAFPTCKSRPYWTGEPYKPNAAYVWIQDFSYGNVYLNYRNNKFRGRAVRRVAAGQ
jgi:Protein of unknown function (DUF1566)